MADEMSGFDRFLKNVGAITPTEGTTALDSIVAKATEEPAELPRLTVANTFLTYQRVGIQLENACAKYKALPEAKSQQDSNDSLKELIRAAEAAIKHCSRLLEANT